MGSLQALQGLHYGRRVANHNSQLVRRDIGWAVELAWKPARSGRSAKD